MNEGLIVIYVLVLITLLYSANRHGKERDNENFWITLVSVILQLLLIWWALDWKFI